VYGERKKYFVLGRREQPRQDKKNRLNHHDKPSEPIKDGPLSYALFEPSFASFSTVSRGPGFSSTFVLIFYMTLPVPDLGKDVAIPGQDRTFPAK
jgi:hypothetical protein